MLSAGYACTRQRVAVRQVHREEVDLPLYPADHRQRFAEVDLRMPGVVAQWHEHFALMLAAFQHVVLNDRDPAAIAVLIPQPLKDPLRGVALLRGPPLILVQDLIDDRD